MILRGQPTARQNRQSSRTTLQISQIGEADRGDHAKDRSGFPRKRPSSRALVWSRWDPKGVFIGLTGPFCSCAAGI